MKKYLLESEGYQRLELIAKKKEAPCGWIRLWEAGILQGQYYFKYQGYEACALELQANTCYELELLGLEVSLCYLCGQDRLLEEGVSFLEFREAEVVRYNQENLFQAYSQEFRNQYHFAPYKNWMNDPNGLCYYNGCYHLFYQYNPNSFQWGNMHWGHAVSGDLLHWTHLPIAAYPQIELLDNPEFRGGAFSGSAVIENGRLQLFYTRHFGKTDRSWQRQWQVTRYTEDGIHFSQEETAIWGTPEGVYYDFRDPKVELIDGTWHMVLGGTVNHIPAVMLYLSENLETWEYQGVLLEERNPKYGISECPDLYRLGDRYILTAGFIYSGSEDTGKRRDTKYYIGTLRNGRFLVESEGIYDYGKDFYAVQSFEREGRRISIGWNCGLEAIWEEGSSNGTMSLPRQQQLSDGRLHMLPVEEVRSLEGRQLPVTWKEEGFEVSISGGYHLEAATVGDMELDLLLAQNMEKKVILQIRDRKVILNTGDETDTCEFETEEGVTQLDIYADRSMIELFINHGRYTCTRRYFIYGKQGRISGAIKTEGCEYGKVHLEVRPVRGIYGMREDGDKHEHQEKD